MNATLHDNDAFPPLDIAAWRRVRLGLTCMRRATIGALDHHHRPAVQTNRKHETEM
jgi:hypothetical protein